MDRMSDGAVFVVVTVEKMCEVFGRNHGLSSAKEGGGGQNHHKGRGGQTHDHCGGRGGRSVGWRMSERWRRL